MLCCIPGCYGPMHFGDNGKFQRLFLYVFLGGASISILQAHKIWRWAPWKGILALDSFEESPQKHLKHMRGAEPTRFIDIWEKKITLLPSTNFQGGYDSDSSFRGLVLSYWYFRQAAITRWFSDRKSETETTMLWIVEQNVYPGVMMG